MDPLSLAGLGLGVASLALQLLGGCIKGYEIFLNMAEMPAKFEHLRLRMRLEQSRLLNWGEKIGLLAEALEQPSMALQLHRNLITDILLEIQRLFKDCLKIEAQFDRVGHLKDDGQFKRAGQVMIQPPDRNGLLAKVLRAWEKTAEVPTRLQWAIVKQDKFEHLIEKLIGYNDTMVSLLDRTTIQQLYGIQVQSQLTLLQLSSKVDDLNQLAQAIQIQTQDRVPMSPDVKFGDLASNLPAEENGLVQLAIFKAQRVTIESDSARLRIKAVDPALISLTNTNSARPLAVYNQQDVWIEWKPYDQDHQLSSWSHMVEDRVRKLAALLAMPYTPKEFRAPHCLGYFHDIEEDEARYGLIYRKPEGFLDAAPFALLDLFRQARKPSLTQRVILGHTISRSIMYLHSVNWLHKGIRSENIVFFVAADDAPVYDAPIISGFDYARPDLPEELTEKPLQNFEHDVYRHPDALGHCETRSKKSWDVYSLGVVLIEIAFWQPIEDILDIHADQKNGWSRLRKIRQMLLEDQFLNRVSVETGERYMNVVRICIRGGVDIGIYDGAEEADPAVGVEMQRVFSEDVVTKLKSIEV